MIETLRRLTPHERQTIVDAGRRGVIAGITVARTILHCSLGDAQHAVVLLLQGAV